MYALLSSRITLLKLLRCVPQHRRQVDEAVRSTDGELISPLPPHVHGGCAMIVFIQDARLSLVALDEIVLRVLRVDTRRHSNHTSDIHKKVVIVVRLLFDLTEDVYIVTNPLRDFPN